MRIFHLSEISLRVAAKTKWGGGGGGGVMVSFFSFSLYCLTLACEYYRQVCFVQSGLQDESLQVTISLLP